MLAAIRTRAPPRRASSIGAVRRRRSLDRRTPSMCGEMGRRAPGHATFQPMPRNRAKAAGPRDAPPAPRGRSGPRRPPGCRERRWCPNIEISRAPERALSAITSMAATDRTDATATNNGPTIGQTAPSGGSCSLSGLQGYAPEAGSGDTADEGGRSTVMRPAGTSHRGVPKSRLTPGRFVGLHGPSPPARPSDVARLRLLRVRRARCCMHRGSRARGTRGVLGPNPGTAGRQCHRYVYTDASRDRSATHGPGRPARPCRS